MTSSNMYRPTREFRENLEWQLVRHHRRNLREHAHRAAPHRLAKAAVLIVVSASIGATAGFASAQVRQGGVRDSLLAAAQVDAVLAKTRFAIAKAEADDLSVRARAGGADQAEVAAAIAELRDMESREKAAELNIQEISASGQAARDDLGAPLVGGRDYVKQRIALQLVAAQARLNAAETTQENAERRYRAGGDDENVVASTRLKVIHVRGQLAVLAEQMKARDEFLAHGTSPALLAQRVEEAQLRSDAVFGQADLDAARARLAVMEKKRAAGAVTDVDLLRAQLAVKELEIDLQRLATRLRKSR